jgi:hypothetical protein
MIPVASGNLENPSAGMFEFEDWTDNDWNDSFVQVDLNYA